MVLPNRVVGYIPASDSGDSPTTYNFASLDHEVLQASFAWSGEHLHRFTVHGRDYGSRVTATRLLPGRGPEHAARRRFR